MISPITQALVFLFEKQKKNTIQTLQNLKKEGWNMFSPKMNKREREEESGCCNHKGIEREGSVNSNLGEVDWSIMSLYTTLPVLCPITHFLTHVGKKYLRVLPVYLNS